MEKVEPRLGPGDSAQIRPPWADTICLAKYKPKPEPPVFTFCPSSPRANFSKRRFLVSSDMPTPESLTETRALRLGVFSNLIFTKPCCPVFIAAGVYLM